MKRFCLLLAIFATSIFCVSADEGQNTSNEDVIHLVVDEMPQFPGGQEALVNYLNYNIQYPGGGDVDIQGRVYVQFVVETDGSISNVVVIRGVDELLDNEAVRVVKAMPNWIPGSHQGTPVRVRYTLPIRFKL